MALPSRVLVHPAEPGSPSNRGGDRLLLQLRPGRVFVGVRHGKRRRTSQHRREPDRPSYRRTDRYPDPRQLSAGTILFIQSAGRLFSVKSGKPGRGSKLLSTCGRSDSIGSATHNQILYMVDGKNAKTFDPNSPRHCHRSGRRRRATCGATDDGMVEYIAAPQMQPT